MANKEYVAIETALVFADSAQTPDETLTLSALAASPSGCRISARHDLGAASHARLFKWRATIQMATAGVPGELIAIYISESDGTNPDGEEGTADAACTIAKLANMTLIGVVEIDTASVDTDITASGSCEINSRYFSVVVENRSADALRTSTTVHGVAIQPIPPELQ